MASSSSSNAAGDGLTPAQRMMQQHASHQPTIEDVPDESDVAPLSEKSDPPLVASSVDPTAPNGAPMSAKAAGKQRAQDDASRPSAATTTTRTTQNAPLDTQSEEAFPALAPSKAKSPVAMGGWGVRPPSALSTAPNGSAIRSNASTQPSSKPVSGTSTPMSTAPASAARSAVPPAALSKGPAHQVSLPGRYAEDMQMPVSSLRKDLKKPFMEIVRDINKRSKAKVDMTSTNDLVTFRGQGPSQESVQEILKEVAAQVGKKETIKVPIPSSMRAIVIGKQGATIQNISKRSGARVQMPKADPSVPADDDNDDSIVEVDVEGNPIAVRLAKNEIDAIVGQRSSNATLKMKDIPAEFFPFIAGPRNSRINSLQAGREVRINVPHYYEWRSQPPPESQAPGQPLPFAPQDGFHIHIAGDRDAMRQVQAEVERQVNELQNGLTVNHIPGIERGRHQFMLGEQGASLHDFLEDTGCAIVLPPDAHDTETIAVVGPPERIEEATEKAMNLAAKMNITNVDIARQHQGPREEAHAHGLDLARYLRQRNALRRLEDQHKAQFMFPTGRGSTEPWQIYTVEPEAGMRARTGVLNLVSGHPPSRFRGVDVHPFYHRGLRSRHAQQLRDQHGVHMVLPEDDNEDARVLLVYESQAPAEDYAFPQKRPSPAEVAEFEQALQQAESTLLALIGEQQEIVRRSVDAPVKYREKLTRYVHRDQQRDAAELYPVEFFGLDGTPLAANGATFPVEFRGPTSAVDDYITKLNAFIEEQIRDEAERDYTVSCNFPKKFANVLIGKKGENINKLRDEFDVEIQVKEDIVEVQGPKAKADAAKAHIMSLAKKLEDETTHVLKVEPKFHRDLIGAKGAQVLKLQDRYNVRIQFPRSAAASAADDDSTADGASDAGASNKRRGPALGPDEIMIKGPRKGADEARDEIWALYQYAKELSHTATISVSQSQIPSLIGQGGRELQVLRDTTGADIDIPSRDTVDASGRVDVKLKGRKDAVAKAKEIIETKVKTFDQSVRRTIEVDRQHHGALIGGNGDNIRQLIVAAGGTGDPQQLGQMVQFPKPQTGENAIRVEGDKDVVDKIVQAIEEFVRLRENQVTETMEVPADRHGALIGRGGQVRKTLEAENSITLAIPPTSATGPARSQIKITGLPADVEKAKGKINAILNERKGETLQVPTRMHHAISENGTFFRTLNRDLRVTVDHQGQRPPAKDTAASPKPSIAVDAMPLITDEASGPPPELSQDEIEAKLTFETARMVPSAPSDAEDPTIPWILKGDAESVAKAKAMIEAALIAADSSVTGYLVLPDPRLHKSVIGPGGSTVNSIRKATGCKVDVPKAGESGAIEIKGAEDRVKEAKAMIVEAVVENQARR